MKTIILATAALAISTMSASAASIPEGCVPAVQNWQNASGFTCPVADASAAPSPFIHKPKKDECETDCEEPTGRSGKRSKS